MNMKWEKMTRINMNIIKIRLNVNPTKLTLLKEKDVMKNYINKAIMYLMVFIVIFVTNNGKAVLANEQISSVESVQIVTYEESSGQGSNEPTPTPTPTPTPPPWPPQIIVPLPTATPVGAPMIRLLDPTQIMMEAGDKKIVPVSLRNAGLYRANNIVITAVASADAPFRVEIKDKQEIRTIQRGATEILSLEFDIDTNARHGTYQVELNYSYHNEANETFRGTDTINVRIDNEQVTPVLIISDYEVSNRNITAGESFRIQARLVNVTNQNATNIQVSVGGFVNGIGLLNDSSIRYYTNTQEISQPFSFALTTSETMSTGSYPINFGVRFFGEDGREYTNEFVYYVHVQAIEEEEEEEEEEKDRPVIEIRSVRSPSNIIEIDNDFEITLNLQNTGLERARNVRISADYENNQAIVPKSASVQQVQLLQPSESGEVTFKFAPTRFAQTRSYTIGFNVSYETGINSAVESFYVYAGVNVYSPEEEDEEDEEKKEKAIIEIRSIHSPEDIISLDEDFEITLNLVNAGLEQARHVRISSEYADTQAIIPKSASVQQIQSLQPSESGEVTFRFSPTRFSQTQNYTIGFNVMYETGIDSEVESFNIYAGVNVYNPEPEEPEDEIEGNRSIPRIIISRYSSEPSIVEAGQEFDLNLRFRNTSRTTPIRNIKAFITVDERSQEKGNVFSPVNASNTFFIEEISPNAESDHSLRLYTVPDADTRTYTILINFEYEDADANAYTAVEQVGINVRQTVRLDTDNFNVPQWANAYEMVPISFEIFNTGNVRLSNVKVHLEVVSGEFDITGSSMFYGTMDTGISEYYDGVFIATMPGDIEGLAVVSYNDDTGTEFRHELPFALNVSEPMMMDHGDFDRHMYEDLSQESSIWGGTLFWSIVGVTAAIVIFIFRKKILKKLRKDKYNDNEASKYE